MATLPEAKYIWFNGKLIPWHDAKIHVLSHVVHYGTSFFEGMRCYETRRGPAIFRLGEHIERLYESCKIYRVEIPYSREQIRTAILETVRANELRSCYVRPVVYRGYGLLKVDPFGCPVEVAVAAWHWGDYLGDSALKDGVDVCISSWNRPAPNTHPTLAKVGGNYMNAQLIRMEAIVNGYKEGIALNVDGLVSEGSGENIFIAKNGELYTNTFSASILGGITRNSIIKLAQDLGLTVREQDIPREMLYIADEVFFVGSAVEITPVRSIDRIPIGSGTRGPITAQLQERFFGITTGESDDVHGWLTHV
ncbi:MAG: branched-chain amino acid transaminase [candidate division Zixibacteria bacterium]|nr:branched-chain amino acid transaminase [candidate division Zixibacteria bacterium]